MRTIKRTSSFKKDYKRALKSGKYSGLEEILREVLNLLINDEELPSNLYDHSLTGNWQDFRECHIKPDFLLIYRKPDDLTLDLVRLGSHSELFE